MIRERFTLSLALVLTLAVLLSAAWAQTPPKEPVDAPITATGLFASEAASRGLDAQSIAFFRRPGSEPLYSGVAISSTSAATMRSRSACTGADTPSPSRSWS